MSSSRALIFASHSVMPRSRTFASPQSLPRPGWLRQNFEKRRQKQQGHHDDNCGDHRSHDEYELRYHG